MERESFKSRLGFLLVSAGCAIGLGNVWKFPYMAAQNGGGIFVLIYLLFLAILGIPVLTMELAIGRASKKSIVEAYKELEPEKSKWHLHGWVSVAGCFMLMMYYTTVAGWLLNYCYKFAIGVFDTVTTETSDSLFVNMLGNPIEMLIFMGLTVVLGFLVCGIGLKKGVERITKVMMICLLVLIVVLAIHSITLKGGGEGLKYYLVPNIDNFNKIGWWNVISGAMSQAFFTLSLGIGSMEIFGSYMNKDHSLTGEAVRITALDTFVALMSGLIIFPAISAFGNLGTDATAGPSLIFMTLPKIFLNMPLGRVWGTLFFLFMSFAAFSTVTAVFENLISSAMDNWKWSRVKSTVVNGIAMLIASLPCLLGYNIWKHIHPIGKFDILDSEDFIVSYILLPVGALIYVLFCTTKFGWGFDKFLKETNEGKGIKLHKSFRFFLKYVLPVIILVLFVSGIISQLTAAFSK